MRVDVALATLEAADRSAEYMLARLQQIGRAAQQARQGPRNWHALRMRVAEAARDLGCLAKARRGGVRAADSWKWLERAIDNVAVLAPISQRGALALALCREQRAGGVEAAALSTRLWRHLTESGPGELAQWGPGRGGARWRRFAQLAGDGPSEENTAHPSGDGRVSLSPSGDGSEATAGSEEDTRHLDTVLLVLHVLGRLAELAKGAPPPRLAACRRAGRRLHEWQNHKWHLLALAHEVGLMARRGWMGARYGLQLARHGVAWVGPLTAMAELCLRLVSALYGGAAARRASDALVAPPSRRDCDAAIQAVGHLLGEALGRCEPADGGVRVQASLLQMFGWPRPGGRTWPRLPRSPDRSRSPPPQERPNFGPREIAPGVQLCECARCYCSWVLDRRPGRSSGQTRLEHWWGERPWRPTPWTWRPLPPQETVQPQEVLEEHGFVPIRRHGEDDTGIVDDIVALLRNAVNQASHGIGGYGKAGVMWRAEVTKVAEALELEARSDSD